MTNTPEAEQKKELGNKAFAAKEFDKAIELYTEAIGIDAKNHVYFSNRSACHASKFNWEASAEDAKECVRLNPSFVKGWYRLAAAQIELNKLDEAQYTVKQGLNVDPENSQLQKQLRSIKTKKASMRRSFSAAAAGSGNNAAAAQIPRISASDSSLSREIMDLQNQLINTSREFNTVKANIVKAQRTQKMDELTQQELEKLPLDSNSRMYRGVGKMFMLSNRSDILQSLKKSVETEQKREAELTQKLDYLERRIKSQQMNIQELAKTSSE